MVFNPLKKIMKTKYTAVDFGHHSIKVAHGRCRGASLKISKQGQQVLPGGAIKDGEVSDVSLLVNSLENLMNKLSLSPGRIIFSPAGGKEFVRRIDMPLMPEDELKEALRWEVEEYLDRPPETTSYDFVKLRENEDGQQVLLVVLANDILNKYIQVFDQLSYTPRTANVHDLALTSLLNYQEKLQDTTLIVDMGGGLTRILIVSDDNFYLSRTLEIGGEDFTAVFENQGMDTAKAEEMKKQSQLESAEESLQENEPMDIDIMISEMEEGKDVNSEFANLASRLSTEINRSIEYYQNRHSGKSIEDIFVTGGGFALSGLKEYVSEELERNLKEVNPFSGITLKNEDNIPVLRREMAVSIGLIVSEVLYYES